MCEFLYVERLKELSSTKKCSLYLQQNLYRRPIPFMIRFSNHNPEQNDPVQTQEIVMNDLTKEELMKIFNEGKNLTDKPIYIDFYADW